MCTAPGRRPSSRARTRTSYRSPPTAAPTDWGVPRPSTGPTACTNSPPSSCATPTSTSSCCNVPMRPNWRLSGSAAAARDATCPRSTSSTTLRKPTFRTRGTQRGTCRTSPWSTSPTSTPLSGRRLHSDHRHRTRHRRPRTSVDGRNRPCRRRRQRSRPAGTDGRHRPAAALRPCRSARRLRHAHSGSTTPSRAAGRALPRPGPSPA